MGRTPHILIVEDQTNTAEMLSSYFDAQGYEVTSVGWGEEALSFVDETVPDLVMLDIRLPDIDGFEVYRRLRARRRTENVPVIFLTNRSKQEEKLEGLRMGAADYITKPFDVQELKLRVRNVLRRSDMGQLTHPITRLPGPRVTEERLRDLLMDEEGGWALLSVRIEGLDSFADMYGFVARDDVIRAVALMLRHVLDEVSDPNPFVGHLSDSTFYVVTREEDIGEVQEALSVRLNETLSFFYPRTDLEAKQSGEEVDLPELVVHLGLLRASDREFSGIAGLKQAITESQVVRPAA